MSTDLTSKQIDIVYGDKYHIYFKINDTEKTFSDCDEFKMSIYDETGGEVDVIINDYIDDMTKTVGFYVDSTKYPKGMTGIYFVIGGSIGSPVEISITIINGEPFNVI